ncbi:MAG: NAD(P)H-binding protein [Actinobacteria bacterium]|nr:NAD(P)H-binding protein [Actinomycetota bacterium]MBI3685920.1 NAD(P)H-binding protein [Actinomycetota bacterium]
MSSSVLVTGATGKTGRRLTPQLVERGVTVRAASRDPVPPSAGMEPVRFDWLDETTYPAALDRVHAAYLVVTDNAIGQAGAFLMTGPESLTLAEVAGHISAAAGRQVRYVESGPEPIQEALIAAGITADFAAYVAQLYTASAGSGAMAAVTDDVAAVTGRPPTSFANYAADAAGAWLR